MLSDKMKKIICDTQGNIFLHTNEMSYDMNLFVPAYMKSYFCEHSMDTLYSRYQMAPAEECLDFILPEIKTPKIESPQYQSNVMYWIGYMYRMLYFSLDIKSKDIILSVPFQDMLVYYPGLHTVAYEMAVEIIKENKFSYVA